MVLETYVSVNYEWLIFPISIVLLTLIFLLTTMIKSYRHGTHVWKSSTLAVLSALGPEAREALGVPGSIVDMDAKAKKLRLVMRQREEGWRMEVVGHDAKAGI